MTRILPPADENTSKALRMVCQSEAWEYVRAWLEENLRRTQDELYDETDPMRMNRLVGRHEAIYGMLAEIENSPQNEASFAKANSSSEIGSMV